MNVVRLRNERGASSVEYGLIAVAIAALIVAIVFALGDVVSETYNDSCTTIHNETKTDATC